MRHPSGNERHGGRRIDAPRDAAPEVSFKGLAIGSAALGLAGLVLYPLMPALGAGAFLLGRLGRERAAHARPFRIMSTIGLVLGALEVAIGLVLTILVLFVFVAD